MSRVDSVRQQSRSGGSSPIHHSNRDIVNSINVLVVTAMPHIAVGNRIVRSSSDSSILIDTDKHRGLTITIIMIIIIVYFELML